MGKEWLYWVGGGGGGGGGGRRRSSAARRGRMFGEMKDAGTSAGCMCAVFQLFDNFHHFHLPLNQHSPSEFRPEKHFLKEELATTSKGVEAPRNSLELEEPAAMDAASVPLAMKQQEENLNFPVGIQIKTRHGKNTSSSPRISTSKSRILDDFSSECSSGSPGLSKTPNLVARLMGLDLLPACDSPTISSTISSGRMKAHLHQNDDIGVGTRSLPETPRISSARRSDVEQYTHRLSLQINKENTNQELEITGARRGRFGLQPLDDNTSPGHYARQIVKQVKDSVSRRVGLIDITNTNRNRETRRDENLILLKSAKKNSKAPSRSDRDIAKMGEKSPRHSVSSDDHHQARGIRNPLQENHHHHQQQQQQKESGKCSSSGLNKLPRQTIRKKKEEPFVHSTAKNKVNLTEKKKSKKTPLISSDIINISGPTVLQIKKDPSPPPTKLPQKQSQVSDAHSSKRSTQLSSKPSRSYKQPDKIFIVPENVPPDRANGCATATPGGAAAEYGGYIQRILKRAGIINRATLAKCHTPSHPIDPLVFHYLELFPPRTATAAVEGCNAILSHRCNRKLIFQLVDELLAEILRPHLNLNPWASLITEDDDQFPLYDELCKKTDSFPAANCQVLEDIDSLIDRDLRKSQLSGFFEEDGDSIVCEIESEIVERLVRETVAVIGGRTAEEQTVADRCHVEGYDVL